MRIRITLELHESAEKLDCPWDDPDGGTGWLDLRENPAAVEQIESARQYLPLRNFLAAVNSGDSFFSTLRCKTWFKPADSPSVPDLQTNAWEFGSRVDVMFAANKFNVESARYDDLTSRLQELLARDAAPDTLHVELGIHFCQFRAIDRLGFCLRILLNAHGATGKQAHLRWGLGLARIQQALLFISRALRQQMAQVS